MEPLFQYRYYCPLPVHLEASVAVDHDHDVLEPSLWAGPGGIWWGSLKGAHAPCKNQLFGVTYHHEAFPFRGTVSGW